MTDQSKDLLIVHGDARQIPLPDDTVQCIVTSPPYWGLRKYAGEQELIWLPQDHPKGSDFPEMCPHEWENLESAIDNNNGNESDTAKMAFNVDNRYTKINSGTCTRCGAWRGAYGLESTIEMYVVHTLEILRECRRVLRPDGVLFWNIGDSYALDAAKGHHKPGDAGMQKYIIERGGGKAANQIHLGGSALKPKDLCLVPARVALAAQADGWWVRSMIIWAKPNPMPESVTDRPTDAYEHILMLTKSERYYWDADAVREAADPANVRRNMLRGPKNATRQSNGDFSDSAFSSGFTGTRNIRNIWNFATQPYSGAHFATFPEELPRRCILAATSAKGCCIQCGAPWERVVRASGGTIGKSFNDHGNDLGEGRSQKKDNAFYADDYKRETIGWRPTCLCPGQRADAASVEKRKIARCLVLDPFGGSGTTGRVALELCRRAVLVDIAYNAEYKELAERRTSGVNVKLPFL